MADDVGDVLRAWRTARGLSLRELAALANVTKGQLSNIETGRRPMTGVVARACDRAFGTRMFVPIVDARGDHMRRRALITAAIASAATPLLPPDVLRTRLADSAEGMNATDWLSIAEDYSAQFAIGTTADYGPRLLGDLAAVQSAVSGPRPSRELVRAAAAMTQCYGLYAGELGDVAGAHHWYALAATIAERSEHPDTIAYVRGRTASRAPYEGVSTASTVRLAQRVIDMQRPCAGTVEAWSALVHAYALTGQLREGRAAVAGMMRAADALPDSDAPTGAHRRAVLFHNYLECRNGGRRESEKAHTIAERELRDLPSWLADARLYRARSLVLDGHVASGVDLALAAVTSLGPVRTLSIAVSDVLSVVPHGYASDALDELRTHASRGPLPWESLREEQRK